jgi:hypothetical protein
MACTHRPLYDVLNPVVEAAGTGVRRAPWSPLPLGGSDCPRAAASIRAIKGSELHICQDNAVRP